MPLAARPPTDPECLSPFSLQVHNLKCCRDAANTDEAPAGNIVEVALIWTSTSRYAHAVVGDRRGVRRRLLRLGVAASEFFDEADEGVGRVFQGNDGRAVLSTGKCDVAHDPAIAQVTGCGAHALIHAKDHDA